MEVDARWFILNLAILYCTLGSVFTDTCTKVNSCKCKLSDGKVIDLSPLAKSKGPRFADISDSQNADKFSYNPCKSFSEGSCNKVAVCQLRSDTAGNTYYYNAGDQSSATFVYDNSNNIYTLQYSADAFHQEKSNTSIALQSSYVLRSTVVNLVCDKSKEADFVAVGELSTSTYVLVLTTKYACAVSEPLSAGTILIIIFFSLVAVYLVGGIIFQIFVRKNSGKRIIPNYDFWTGLPSLVKDGTLLIIRRGKGKQSYSNI